MSHEFKAIVARNAPNMLSDAVGLTALCALLFVGLHLPGFI